MAKSHAHARELREVLRVFALFGHPIRVVIFQRLARQPATAGVLAQQLPISRAAVVQHVKRLEQAGLLMGLRDGKRRVYHAQPRGLEPLARWLAIHRTAARYGHTALHKGSRRTRWRTGARNLRRTSKLWH
jgi:DNA-binding transcriptional ArsR family regulator